MGGRKIVVAAVLAAGATVVVLVALVAGRDASPSPTSAGTQSSNALSGSFSQARGDPVNVELSRQGKDDCLTISGDPYETTTFCFALTDASVGVVRTMMFPVKGTGPTLVVGVLPHGARTALVPLGTSSDPVGGSTAVGTTHGRLYLVRLPPGRVDVERGPTVDFK